MARKGLPWSAEEDALLCDLRRQGLTWSRIAARLGRTEGAVSNRHSELMTGKTVSGASRGRFDPWRAEEDAVLIEAYRQPGGPDLQEASRRIGRSLGACRSRAKVLGLAQRRASPQKRRGNSGSRRCHDCGKPTTDYRCPQCLAKWRHKNGVRDASEEEGLC